VAEQYTTASIDVETLYKENKEVLSLTLINNTSSFRRRIREGELHRPGLALSGFVNVFTYWRVQIFGNTEIAFLHTFEPKARRDIIAKVLGFELPCIIITNDNQAPAELIEVANHNNISIFSTPFNTTRVIHTLSEYLDRKFAPNIVVHGSLVAVYGIGLLFTGRSGIGKSEVALDLVERGHRLVADDVVHILRRGDDVLIGMPSPALQHHMEIRGLGIIDLRRIFGIRSIRKRKRIEVEVRLEEWDQSEDYERTGLDENLTSILDVEIPLVRLPIFPGKNITVIAEVIATNYLLKVFGEHPAKEFNKQLIEDMAKNYPQPEDFGVDNE
jgi:HPr kinase/phosphorylase